jgi:hypothetical protein
MRPVSVAPVNGSGVVPSRIQVITWMGRVAPATALASVNAGAAALG